MAGLPSRGITVGQALAEFLQVLDVEYPAALSAVSEFDGSDVALVGPPAKLLRRDGHDMALDCLSRSVGRQHLGARHVGRRLGRTCFASISMSLFVAVHVDKVTVI